MNAPPLMKVFGPETKKRMDALKGTIATIG
jgi:hypothetical protein